MDWTILLCSVFVNVIPSQGDGIRMRFPMGNFGKVASRDYFRLGDTKHISDIFSNEKMLPGHTLLNAVKFPQVPLDQKKQRTHYRKSSDLPNLLRSYFDHRLNQIADKRRSTLTQHSEEVKESILPPSEPVRPGHTLIQPTKTMLQSAAKYPRTDGVSLVYGNQDNLGIVHGQTPYSVVYSDFRKDNLAELLKNILKDPNSIGDLRRSTKAKTKLSGKIKPLKGKNKNKKGKKFKKLDSKRSQMYRSDFDSSNGIRKNNVNIGSRGKIKNKKKVEQHDIDSNDSSKETNTRAFQNTGNFGSYKKKSNPKLNKKKTKHFAPEKKVNIHSKIVEKLNEKLDEKLKMSKLKKQVPLDTYKKKMSKMKKKARRPVRQGDHYETSSIESYSRELSPKYKYNPKFSKESSEDSYSREDKSRVYKNYKKKTENVLKRSKKKQLFRQRDSDESVENQNETNEDKDDESGEKKVQHKQEGKSNDKKNLGRLVYGSPNSYGIVWGKTPYRTMYTDFRRTTSLLSKILEAYHSYKRDKNLKKALVAIKVWPLEKTKMNPNNLDEVQDQISDNNEILDDVSIEIDVAASDFRKQRSKSKTKSAFRSRGENYDKSNNTEKCEKDDEEAEPSDESDYEKNPGNPYTLFKNKYKQNWPWHFELGDHLNLNPFGPEFNNQAGPSGPDLFYNRKWWYFNQDDYIPFR